MARNKAAAATTEPPKNMAQAIVTKAVEKISAQQAGKAGTAPFMVGEQLKDICRREPAAAELILHDLDVSGMGIADAEKKIKAYADAHKTGNFSCVTPAVNEGIFREFYGLQKPTEEEETQVPATSVPGKLVDLADFLV